MRKPWEHTPMGTAMPPLPCTIELGPWWCPPKVVLMDDWWFECEGIRYHVPVGFHSDAASIPRGTKWWNRWLGLVLMAALALLRFGKLRSLRASVAHDALYAQVIMVPRRRADHIFRLLCAYDGVGLLGRWVAWAAVRAGGWAHHGKG